MITVMTIITTICTARDPLLLFLSSFDRIATPKYTTLRYFGNDSVAVDTNNKKPTPTVAQTAVMMCPGIAERRIARSMPKPPFRIMLARDAYIMLRRSVRRASRCSVYLNL